MASCVEALYGHPRERRKNDRTRVNGVRPRDICSGTRDIHLARIKANDTGLGDKRSHLLGRYCMGCVALGDDEQE